MGCQVENLTLFALSSHSYRDLPSTRFLSISPSLIRIFSAMIHLRKHPWHAHRCLQSRCTTTAWSSIVVGPSVNRPDSHKPLLTAYRIRLLVCPPLSLPWGAVEVASGRSPYSDSSTLQLLLCFGCLLCRLMCILVTNINASVLSVPMFLVIAIPVVVTRSLVQPSARRGLSGTPITDNLESRSFFAVVLRSKIKTMLWCH
ncbi:uncharacterized protein F5891DRAFT_746706 [Suillus fuscotomentosus]|uniref:Uncharacterized protein n=1 Tax=Suillus fuscotomentosus TaxID=1912939 RepID=A0AAD4EED2_9AGAM|nr:uncharacterized protein F5891DRAFT_746706 [Suillus fuscotomentosus]KAG1904516.1 hypothetical protein F5891DRAFT_746706 [Suillus fuscotomentosus]